MKQNREEAIGYCLKWEGGYGNDPRDAGGPTNYGITIADVRRFLNPKATALDVKNLTKAQAIDIYRNKYWKTELYDCDKLDSGLDCSVFDCGVNSGVGRSKRFLDQCTTGTTAQKILHFNDLRQAFVRNANK